MDRQFRFRQVLRQETDGLRPGRHLVCSPQRGRQPLHQVDDAQLASLIADDGRGLGTIDLNAAYFLDRENAQQKAAAKFGPCRTKDLLVAELERSEAPSSLRPGRVAVLFRVVWRRSPCGTRCKRWRGRLRGSLCVRRGLSTINSGAKPRTA